MIDNKEPQTNKLLLLATVDSQELYYSILDLYIINRQKMNAIIRTFTMALSIEVVISYISPFISKAIKRSKQEN